MKNMDERKELRFIEDGRELIFQLDYVNGIVNILERLDDETHTLMTTTTEVLTIAYFIMKTQYQIKNHDIAI